MTSFGLCKVFHYKYNTTGHNFTGHYYVLQKEPLVSENFALANVLACTIGAIDIKDILFRLVGFLAPKDLQFILLSNLSILSVPDERYSRKASCTLNLISTF